MGRLSSISYVYLTPESESSQDSQCSQSGTQLGVGRISFRLITGWRGKKDRIRGGEGRKGEERRDLYTLHSLEFITVFWSLYDTTLQTTDMPLILPQSVDRDI